MVPGVGRIRTTELDSFSFERLVRDSFPRTEVSGFEKIFSPSTSPRSPPSCSPLLFQRGKILKIEENGGEINWSSEVITSVAVNFKLSFQLEFGFFLGSRGRVKSDRRVSRYLFEVFNISSLSSLIVLPVDHFVRLINL